MAELLSAGVFIEETAAIQTVQSVSTSNMGIVGFTLQGPIDEPTLVTSFNQFVRLFGSYTSDSRVPLSVQAFFANGGLRAYVNRVVPADATLATGSVQTQHTDQLLSAAASYTSPVESSTPSPLLVNAGDTPIVPSSLTFKWRPAGATASPAIADLSNDPTLDRAGVALVMATGVVVYEGKVDPANLATFDPDLDAMIPGTFIIEWEFGAGPTSTSISVTSTSSGVVTGTNVAGSSVTVDTRSGKFSLEIDASESPTADNNGDPITCSLSTAGGTLTTTDNGSGVLSGDAAGTIDYSTGEYSITMGSADLLTHNYGRILASYKTNAWAIVPVSKGAWANDIRMDIKGNADYYTTATSTYSRFDVNILQRPDSTSSYSIVETYEELSFTSTTSADYFPNVISELSDYVDITAKLTATTPQAVNQLSGVARSVVLAGGDESSSGQTITFTLPDYPIATRTVSIAYTDSTGTARTITDDGSGALTGSVDGSGNNTINYTTGAVDFMTAAAIDANTLVVATYYSAASETSHSEALGDTTKSYTAGSNGTFDSTNYGRTQLTASSLEASNSGIYALNKVDALMQVIVPDLAGDVTATGDILDYVDGRSSQPSGGDRFAILAVPEGSTAQQAVNFFRYDLGRYSDFASLYWPWVKVADPLNNNRPLVFPPLGHIAGIYSRTDNDRNVAKAPAGTIDGAIRGISALEYVSTKGERDLVYPNKINPLISSVQTGLAVWGARTISNDSQWKFIPTRRLFMFIERAIYDSTHWIVFEPNGQGLFTRIKAQLDSYLLSLYNEGMFAGTSPTDSFYVICDSSNNTPATIDQGQVIIDVGIAPTKPAEFVRFKIAQIQL